MKKLFKISLLLLFVLSIQVSYAQQKASDKNLTEITVSNDGELTLDGQQVVLDSLAVQINKKLKSYNPEDLAIQTADIVVSSNTTLQNIQKIKDEVKKTPIQFTNVQRSIVANYSKSGPVTEEMIEQYNTLIEDWNKLDEDERYFRKIELNYVENIHQRMTFQQQVKAKKLPGYLYFVKEPNLTKEISLQDLERWRFDDSYAVFINKSEIEKSVLKAIKPDNLKGYYILKYLVNEEAFYEVYLFTK